MQSEHKEHCTIFTVLNLKYNRQLVLDPAKTRCLEDFWDSNQVIEDERLTTPKCGSISSPKQDGRMSPEITINKRGRAISSASALGPPGQGLSAHHPALSLSEFVDTFGPLVFLLYKAALLRKRILLVTHAPVELTCNFGRIFICPQSCMVY